MEELLGQVGYNFSGVKKGDMVEGVISSISGQEVLIDIGGKSEGVVGHKEWDQIKDFVATLKPGDKIKARIISVENDKGQMILSIKQTSFTNRWDRMQNLLDTGAPVAVRVLEVNRGGLLVETEGARGFIPSSQLAPGHQGDLPKLIGKTLSVKVIEVNAKDNRLVFSERAISEQAERESRLAAIKDKVKIGEKYPGKISAVMGYGLFVSLDAPASGIDGLVHVSEVSWDKIGDLSGAYKIGDPVEVMVIGISEDGKLNLSIKQLLPDPWAGLSEKYVKDQVVKGKISQVASYGIFVTLEEGVDGLIRTSKLPPGQTYEPGDKISCIIESVDLPNHKISLVPVLTDKPLGYK